MRQALAKSSNTIAVKVAETLGDSYDDCVDTMLDYLKNFGLSDLKDGPGGEDRKFSALTLGGMTKGVSPLDMAAAYGTLANGGVYVEPITFTTIESSDGQVLVQNTPEEHKVVDAQVAYVVTDMMKSVITEGTGKSASIGSMPVAGKTGTTNEDKDAWFVGYTPYYVGSTYIGDDYRSNPDTKASIPRRGVAGGSSTSAKLWANVMSKVHDGLKPTEFKKPSSIEFFNINLFTGDVVGKGAYNSAIAAFIKGHTPSGSAIDHTPEVPKATTEEKKQKMKALIILIPKNLKILRHQKIKHQILVQTEQIMVLMVIKVITIKLIYLEELILLNQEMVVECWRKYSAYPRWRH
ncbi:penicillin binding transpeptidase domain protein [[Clostridium] sordellii ATCC 9714]|nr:penicillin binding transpeptidase domain protein [[Clostridium] sordellii ATCC 9714] [Paeniclostridium sordellii ATCC 9714]